MLRLQDFTPRLLFDLLPFDSDAFSLDCLFVTARSRNSILLMPSPFCDTLYADTIAADDKHFSPRVSLPRTPLASGSML